MSQLLYNFDTKNYHKHKRFHGDIPTNLGLIVSHFDETIIVRQVPY
jgi:hypothetical protein